MTDEIKNVASAIHAVMQDVGYVQKTGKNEQQNYTYADEASVIQAVRDSMLTHGLIMVPRVETFERETFDRGSGKPPALVSHVTIRYAIIHTESGESIEVVAAGSGIDYGGDKAVYKAITGAQKYALSKTFILATGDDAERDSMTEDAAPAKPKPKPKPKPAPKPKNETFTEEDEQVEEKPKKSGRKITDKQRKRLYGISRSNDWSKDGFIAKMEEFGYESSSDVLMSDYEDVCAYFEGTPGDEFGQEPEEDE
jgi:hypothetical protein